MFFDDADEFDGLVNDISSEDLDFIRTCEPEEAKAWNDLLTAFQVPSGLDREFYLHTQLPRTRNLLNFPTFQVCTYQDIIGQNLLSFHFFYNQTTKKNFTQSTSTIDGERIGSYLDIEHGTVFGLIEAMRSNPSLIPAALEPLTKLNFPNILCSIGNARLEERRIGVLTHWYHSFNENTYFEFKMPILWMMKNLNFNQKDKDAIAQAFSAALGTSVSTFDETQWGKDHVVFDAIGMGNTELSLCSKLFYGDNWHIDGGAFLFLPTDYQWATGLYGTYIQPKNQHPVLDLCSIVKVASTTLNPDWQKIIGAYADAAVNQLSSALLQCPLGYYQTLVIGLKASPYWQPHENLEFHGLYTIEILFPYEQPRFYVFKNQGEFSKLYNALPNDTDAQGVIKLDLFEARMTELLFPRVYNTRLFPGFIINTTSSLHKSYKTWNFVMGYNCWVQSREQFLNINIPNDEVFYFIPDPDEINLENFEIKNLKRTVTLNDLAIEKSMSQDAYMVKIFGKIHKNFAFARHDLSMTFWLDLAVANNTVGNDFTFGICFDSQF